MFKGIRGMLWGVLFVAAGCGGDDATEGPAKDVQAQDLSEDGEPVADLGEPEVVPYDMNSGPEPTSTYAFRLETRFGTTLSWKGVTVLTPMSLIHSESDSAGACEKEANEVFLQQFTDVVDQVDPFSWQSNYVSGETGVCGSDTFTLVLTIMRTSDWQTHEVRWCENESAAIPGMADFIKKVDKLKADAAQNGTCGKLPFILGRPSAVAMLGSDDGALHLVGLARFQDPDYCLVVYSKYSAEVYQTITTLSADEAFTDELFSMFFPATSRDEVTLPGFVDLCPDAEPLLRDGTFLEDVEPGAGVFLVDSSGDEPSYFVATKGIATVEPLIQAGEPLVFQLSGVEFRPVLGLGGSTTVERGPWHFHYLESTTWETPNVGPGQPRVEAQ